MNRRILAMLVAGGILAGGCSPGAETAGVEGSTSSPTPAATTELSAEVPRVVGLVEEAAVAQLEELGLDVEVRDGDPSDSGALAGRVQAQRPAGGEPLAAGDTVTLEIWQPPEPTATIVGLDQQRSMFAGTMEEGEVRTGLIDSLADDVESVDQFEFDPASDRLVVALTSNYGTERFVADDAWTAGRYLSHLWGAEFWDAVERNEIWTPSLELTVNSLRYVCPGDAMLALAETRMSRAEWESACGR